MMSILGTILALGIIGLVLKFVTLFIGLGLLALAYDILFGRSLK